MTSTLSTKELASLFSVTETTIKRWTDEGEIPCIKTLGGHRKFRMKDVVEFGEKRGYPVIGTIPPSLTRRQYEMLEFSVQTLNYKKISDIFFEEAMQLDRTGLHSLLSYLYKHRISFGVIGDEIIRPAMVRVGELWTEGKLEINQEHRISQLIVESLILLSPELHRKPSNGLSVVCAAAEGEHHEIGLRILAYTLESEGWTVHNIGANTPFNTLHSFIKAMTPNVVCLSTTLQHPKKDIIEHIQNTGRLCHSRKAAFLIGGFFAYSWKTKDFNCDHICTSTHDAVAFLKARFQLKPGPKKSNSVLER